MGNGVPKSVVANDMDELFKKIETSFTMCGTIKFLVQKTSYYLLLYIYSGSFPLPVLKVNMNVLQTLCGQTHFRDWLRAEKAQDFRKAGS